MSDQHVIGTCMSCDHAFIVSEEVIKCPVCKIQRLELKNEILKQTISALSGEVGRLRAIINRAFDVYTDEADPNEGARKMWDILGPGVSEDSAPSAQTPPKPECPPNTVFKEHELEE